MMPEQPLRLIHEDLPKYQALFLVTGLVSFLFVQ